MREKVWRGIRREIEKERNKERKGERDRAGEGNVIEGERIIFSF
jgi:hypothetical protein